MSQARGLYGYAQVGGQYAKDDHFGVRAQVHVPDGDAGTECASCFHAQTKEKKHRFSLSVTPHMAVIFLALVFVSCAFVIGLKAHARSVLSLEISSVNSGMEATRLRIEELTEQVVAKRDASNICVKAVSFGMVAAEETNTRHIYVQEIEQFTKAEEQNGNLSAAQELPLQSGQAQLTGSR